MNPTFVFAVLLVSGHLVGEFLLQTRAVAEGKRRIGPLLIHGAGLYVAHWLLLYPFWCGRLAIGLAVLTAVHLVIDVVRAYRPRTLGAFAADQLLHLIALRFFVTWYDPAAGFALREDLTVGDLATFTRIALLAGAVGLNLRGGDMIVRLLLARFAPLKERLDDEGDELARTGTLIGMLERLLLFVMALLGQWAAVGFLLTAKSVARFDKLKRQDFADYYLIGTLASLLVAVLSGLATRQVLTYLP